MILLLVALGMFAQETAHDVIITHDAQRIDAVITEVSAVEVKYKQANFQNGPTFVVAIDDIATIIYSNGKVQAFQKKATQPTQVVQQGGYSPYGNQTAQNYNDIFLLGTKPAKQKKQHPAPFIGMSAGMGGSFGPYYRSLDGAFSLDMAGSCSNRFALGVYLKYQSVASLSAGMIFLHGNHNEGAAFMWGMGFLGAMPRKLYNLPVPTMPNDEHLTMDRRIFYQLGGELRVGYKFTSSWYMWLDISARSAEVGAEFHHFASHFNNGYTYYDARWDDSTIIATSLSVGYKFPIKQKSTKIEEGVL
jgi:hypothetical protein